MFSMPCNFSKANKPTKSRLFYFEYYTQEEVQIEMLSLSYLIFHIEPHLPFHF